MFNDIKEIVEKMKSMGIEDIHIVDVSDEPFWMVEMSPRSFHRVCFEEDLDGEGNCDELFDGGGTKYFLEALSA